MKPTPTTRQGETQRAGTLSSPVSSNYDVTKSQFGSNCYGGGSTNLDRKRCSSFLLPSHERPKRRVDLPTTVHRLRFRKAAGKAPAFVDPRSQFSLLTGRHVPEVITACAGETHTQRPVGYGAAQPGLAAAPRHGLFAILRRRVSYSHSRNAAECPAKTNELLPCV